MRRGMNKWVTEWVKMDKTVPWSNEIHWWWVSKRKSNCYRGPIWEWRTFGSRTGRKAPGLTSRKEPWTSEEVTHGNLCHNHKNGGQVPLEPQSSRAACPTIIRMPLSPAKLANQHKIECSPCGLHHKSHSTELWTQEHCSGQSPQHHLSGSRKWSHTARRWHSLSPWNLPLVRNPWWGNVIGIQNPSCKGVKKYILWALQPP